VNLHSLFREADRHPLLVTPNEDDSADALREYLAAERPTLEDLLLRHGAILFRGFRLDADDDFRTCCENLGALPFGYVGGDSPRSGVSKDVFTSTDYPAREVIPLHNEMSYLPQWPRRLFFFSKLPARSGGQTPLAYSGEVLRQLPDDIVAKFRAKGIRYIRNFDSRTPLGKSWQATYATSDRHEVEAIVTGQGSTCRWSHDGVLKVSTERPAFTTHPRSGEEQWFNQAEQWHPSAMDPALRRMLDDVIGKGNFPHDCEYGDGEPLDEEALARIRRVLIANKLIFDWQQFDLLMIDNIQMMHGRESFAGERKTLAYLSST
jgi:alpha-ketoglutarate-dependent taurine dioxygenase